MRVQFRKLDLNNLDAIPEKVEVLFVQYRNDFYHQEFIGTIQRAKDFRKYQLENDWTHWLLLPKIHGKP